MSNPIRTVGAVIFLSPIAATLQQMQECGISFDGEHYSFGEYRYDKLADAINYAQASQSQLSSRMESK